MQLPSTLSSSSTNQSSTRKLIRRNHNHHRRLSTPSYPHPSHNPRRSRIHSLGDTALWLSGTLLCFGIPSTPRGSLTPTPHSHTQTQSQTQSTTSSASGSGYEEREGYIDAELRKSRRETMITPPPPAPSPPVVAFRSVRWEDELALGFRDEEEEDMVTLHTESERDVGVHSAYGGWKAVSERLSWEWEEELRRRRRETETVGEGGIGAGWWFGGKNDPWALLPMAEMGSLGMSGVG